MIKLNELMSYEVTKEDLEPAIEFTNLRIERDSKFYSNRNQFDIDKIRQDILNGCKAEIAVWKLFNTDTAPDFNLYEVKKKSYSADLKKGDYDVHVKSITKSSADRFGVSWTFTSTDKLVSNPSKLDVLVLCVVDKDIVYVYSVIKAKQCVYGEPKLDRLKGIKSVIYADSIPDRLIKRKCHVQ